MGSYVLAVEGKMRGGKGTKASRGEMDGKGKEDRKSRWGRTALRWERISPRLLVGVRL